MAQKDNILQELNELKSGLAAVSQQNIYSVPDGYFDGLIEQVMRRIRAMEAANAVEELGHLSPLLSGLSKQMPYTVPQNYFQGLAGNVLATVSNDQQTVKEELETISPLLSGLKKALPYAVPQGYFENLTRQIAAEENKPAAKVISLTNRKWFRYAAAAVIAGLIFMTGFLFNGSNEPGARSLAKFERDVKKMDETQKDNLIDFIELTGEETAKLNTKEKSDEIKNLLQGISDEELKAFEQQTEDLGDVLMTE